MDELRTNHIGCLPLLPWNVTLFLKVYSLTCFKRNRIQIALIDTSQGILAFTLQLIKIRNLTMYAVCCFLAHKSASSIMVGKN